MREPHNSRENIIPRLIQIRTPRERHTQLQSKSICPTSLNRIRDHLTFADASDITRDGNQHSFHQVNHSRYMYCRSLQMLCPQLKELSLYFTASPHRPSHHLSGAAVHPSTLARTARGNAVLQRWRAERPEKSGVPENNIPGP